MATRKSTPRLSSLGRKVLPGSEKAPFSEAAAEKPAPHANRITVSVLVRRKQPLKPDNRQGTVRLTRAQYRKNHSADPAAVKLVRAFANRTHPNVLAACALLCQFRIVKVERRARIREDPSRLFFRRFADDPHLDDRVQSDHVLVQPLNSQRIIHV